MKAIRLLLVLGATTASLAAAEERVIFEDNFDTAESYHEALTQNATCKEYGTNALPAGHLLKKWRYSWDYSYEGDWRQAFYVVAPGESVMTQAGRSGCYNFNHRIVADARIPDTATNYRITFRQWKADNDTIFYIVGADETAAKGARFGFENQLPGTDTTVDDIYLRGIFGNNVIRRSLAFRRQWVAVEIAVDVKAKTVAWKMNDTLVAEAHVPDLEPGGYFGLYMCYERNTQFDDFRITVSE